MTYRPGGFGVQSALRGWWRRLTALWRNDEIDRGLNDEISFHIEQQTAKNIRQGMAADEARRAADLWVRLRRAWRGA